MDIIKRAHEIGLFVTNITSDMGGSNQAMWSKFGIYVNKYSTPKVRIEHPCDSSRNLYLIPDVPHIIKNLRAAFVKMDFRYNGKLFSVEHVKRVAEMDETRDMKLAPNLKLSDMETGHFQKMKVSSAMHVFSNSVASAITFMVENNMIDKSVHKSAVDTAWFISTMNRWFDLMSSRTPAMALSKLHPEKFNEAKEFLMQVIDLFTHISIGKGQWKPVQTGIILATTGILQLAEELIDGGMDFVMTARLTQDCLENLFSTIRLKTATPSAIEFRNSLKIVTVAQFLKTPKNSSYQLDESTYLGSYLEKAPEIQTIELLDNTEEIVVFDEAKCISLDLCELNSLYYLCGWSLKCVPKCEDCVKSTISPSPVPSLSYASDLTERKEYKLNALRHPTEKVFLMFNDVEKVFLLWRDTITEVQGDVVAFLYGKISSAITDYTFTQCHDVKKLIVMKYLKLRIHITCQKLSKDNKDKSTSYMGSRSMAMREAVKKMK